MELLDKWHDFFIVLGAAAGTLIGSMFVVVSIGSGLVKGSELTSRIFVTPTIIHLAAGLMSCAFVLMPTLTRFGLGAAAGVGGIAFLGYAGRNMFHIHRRAELLWSDWFWYGVAPLCAYLVMLAGGVMVLEAAQIRDRGDCRRAGAAGDQRHSQRVGSDPFLPGAPRRRGRYARCLTLSESRFMLRRNLNLLRMNRFGAFEQLRPGFSEPFSEQ